MHTFTLQVDRVKVDRISEFTPLPELTNRVLTVEKGRDGVISVALVDAHESTVPLKTERGSDGTHVMHTPAPAIAAYDIDYSVDSTRGLIHYSTRCTIYDHKLYVLTAQCDESNYADVKDEIATVINSFQLQTKQ